MTCPRGRAGTRAQAALTLEPVLLALPHSCPQAQPWLGRGPIPSQFPRAQLIPSQGPPAQEPISACHAGGTTPVPLLWAPQRPSPAQILGAPPSALETDASSIAPLRKRTKAHFLSERLGEHKASERHIPASGFFQALAGPPVEHCLPLTPAAGSLLSPGTTSLSPTWRQEPPRSSVTGAAGGAGCIFSPACRVWLQQKRRKRKKRSLRW